VDVAVVAAAAAFAVLNGVNDGGTLVAMGLKMPSVKLGTGLLLLAGSVVAVPLLLGTAVAVTLADRLVSFEGETGRVAILVAVLSAMGVVAWLAHRSLPTSLTLALVGGLTGAGLGSGLPIAWGWLAFVLAMAAIAPALGAALGYALSRMALRMSRPGGASAAVQGAHRFAFAGQCVAYGANDGQKMLAVFMIATATQTSRPPVLTILAIGLLFLLGSMLGVRRFSGTLATGILPARPINTVAAEMSSAMAVLASAGAGAPVSMTQAVAGGLVGSGISDGYRRIRWRTASQIAVAWALTLPMAVVLSAALAAGYDVFR
jgi:inorganic phosphate transporter, PiT family